MTPSCNHEIFIMTTTGLITSSFKRLLRVNYYMLALVLLTLVTCSFVSNKTGPLVSPEPNTAYILKIALFFVVALVMFVGFYLPSKILRDLSPHIYLKEKVTEYIKAQLYRIGFFSFAAIIVSIYFLLTSDTNILLIKAIIILFMMVYKPSKLKVRSDLSLTDQEYNELFGKD